MGVYPTGVQARRPGGVARARVGEERGVPRFSQVRHYFISLYRWNHSKSKPAAAGLRGGGDQSLRRTDKLHQ